MKEVTNAFFIGGGSFSMPRYVKSMHPDINVDVAEIDKDVVNAAYRYLELSGDINILIGDGRQVLKEQSKVYDLIVNDAFNGVRKIPFHMVTKEFVFLVSNKISRHGMYAVNVIGYSSSSNLVKSITKTIMEEFEFVSHFRGKDNKSRNVWILASHSPIGLGVRQLPSGAEGQVLTDDNAPVEFIIAKELMKKT